LDLGCGLGRHMLYFQELGIKAIGCDISSNVVERAEEMARSRGIHLELVQCDYVDLPFNNGIFGGVLAIDAIHHDFLEKIIQTLREIHRVLAPEGFICLNPVSIKDELFGKGRKLGERLFLIHRVPHYFFEKEEIVYLLEQTFFKTIKIEKENYVYEKDGQKLKREKFKIIAQKVIKPRGFFHPSQLPLY